MENTNTGNDVPGAHDQRLSSREKDALLADAPVDNDPTRQLSEIRQQALDDHRARTIGDGTGFEPNFAEPRPPHQSISDDDRARAAVQSPSDVNKDSTAAAPVQVEAPPRHEHSSYEPEVQESIVDDADFDAEEQNQQNKENDADERN